MGSKPGREKKKIVPVLVALVLFLFFAVIVGVLVWGRMTEPIPWVILIPYFIVCVGGMIGILTALVQRIKEINGGEEDDISNY